MKNLKSFRFAIVIATAILFIGTGCSKESSTLVNNAAKPTAQLKEIDPVDQQYGAVKGYVLPAKAQATITLINQADGSVYSTAADDTGLFSIEKLPAGLYTADIEPLNPGFGSVQFDVIISGGSTTVLNVTLPKS